MEGKTTLYEKTSEHEGVCGFPTKANPNPQYDLLPTSAFEDK
jgi:hypothetical protein